MTIYTPYFYIIQEVSTGIYYAGAKWAKDADPDMFMCVDGYTTSSNKVNAIISRDGLDAFIIRKIRVFKDLETVEIYEKRFLNRVNAAENNKFHNAHNGNNLMTYGTETYYDHMMTTYGVKHALQSEEIKLKQRNNNLKKYGVANVFAAEEIKNKIKETNLERYGCIHPSFSKELLDKKANNNIIKYGVSSNLNLPHVKEKALIALKSERVIEKRKQSFISKYGVENAGQVHSIREAIEETRKNLSLRDSVKMLREYARLFDIKFGSGWYQSSDEVILKYLELVQNEHGIYEYDELVGMTRASKYSNSIRKLQSREIVREIWKYKNLYGKKIKIGRCWDRKSDEYLELILETLKNEFGVIR